MARKRWAHERHSAQIDEIKKVYSDLYSPRDALADMQRRLRRWSGGLRLRSNRHWNKGSAASHKVSGSTGPRCGPVELQRRIANPRQQGPSFFLWNDQSKGAFRGIVRCFFTSTTSTPM